MDQNAVDFVVTDKTLTPSNTLFDGNGVRSLAISLDEFIKIVINKAKGRCVHNARDVKAVSFERLEEVRQFRPARNAFEHDTMLFLERSGRRAVLDVFFQFAGEQFECFSSFDTAAGRYDRQPYG